MGNFTRNFLAGRMNKVVDQRLLPESEYVDAMNIRMGSTEKSEVGVITNTKGNLPLTKLAYIVDGTSLSANARCIGAIEDSANETIYWFVHDPTFTVGATGKLDLIVSYNVLRDVLTYHVISIDDGGGIDTTLNFNSTYLITGVSLIDNLIFFTDDYNPPRFINIRPVRNRYPNPISDIDQVSAEALLVIKKPPIESPTIIPIKTSGQENFLETRFICFAYRYKYVDGEYSATSQWSEPAFIPQPFEFSINSMLNEGMVNSCNTSIIEYNSGGPLVVGVDLLFKESNKNIIKIIEQLDKAADLGGVDNQVLQYSFNNSKIFTVLNEAEILRLYDNVPRFAKAQTIMGNRLMYGNYVEGYDLIDEKEVPVKIEYTTSLTSEAIGQTSIPDSTDNGIYNIDPSALGQTITDSIVTFDLTGINLVAGSSITINLSLTHSTFTGSLPFPTETTDFVVLEFVFNLSTNYSSVYALATSPEFTLAIGTAANIKPVYSSTPGVQTSCDGTTLTDSFNCFLPANLGSLLKYGSGINSILQPIKIISTPASNIIGLQIPAMEYVNSLTTPTQRVYEYYDFTYALATFQEIGNPSSLHSNRGYEIGIVYMDEFNRSTTALVSQTNTVFVPCDASASKNTIQVTIPPTQIAPYWATRYKFVIKPDAENYETIYSNIFFTDKNTNEVYFLIEGENTKKVEIGDRLIVKADTSGPTTNCAYATVLDKKSQSSNFIVPKENVPVLAGLYIKINPNSFNVVVDPDATINPGNRYERAFADQCVTIDYPMNIGRAAGFDPAHPSWIYEDYTVPAGSRIKISVSGYRPEVGSIGCFSASWVNEFVSSRNYDNMYDWFVGDNISSTLSNPNVYGCSGSSIQYIPGFGTPSSCERYTMYMQFDRNLTTNRLVLNVRGVSGKLFIFSEVSVSLTVFRAINTIIWETEPSDALPDVFFENNLSFAIDSNGYHDGNIQNQTSSLPAIIDTGFYNCFTFGNGAESYKIRDSLIGKSFNFGERVTTVAAQDYKMADRFSDITYSGIYNGESNINKLNEFNSGLLNFKHCEGSFGEIQYLDGRNTDILCLQEDKISYVLAEKNLLSDASAGGIITATPEVLGTQIARTEKYGISFNPESYVQWGYDRFFTDAKRGSVIQLKGGEDQNEQLIVTSDQNMRTWFRDEFNSSFNYQKLGGFDPYMNEYVLSMNDQQLPINPQCLDCGISQTFTLSVGVEVSKTQIYCVDLGPTVGNTNIRWEFANIESGKTLEVSVLYNGVTVTSGPVDTDGQITFNKDNILIQTAQITLTYTGDMTVSVTAECTEAEELNIVEVVLTNNSEAGKTIHTQYRYTNLSFVGPLLSNLVPFIIDTTSPVVSRYNITTGFAGQGGFPPESSVMSLISNAIVPDDFVFDTTYNKFRYLRSNTLYGNNNIDIQSLLLSSTTITPITGSAPVYSGDFTVPASIDGNYLYLIWDFRSAIETELCFAKTRIDSCCDCVTDIYYLDGAFNVATSVWADDTLTTFAEDGFYSLGGIVRELTIDGVLLPQQTCAPCAVEVSLCFGVSSFDVCCVCNTSCPTPYNSYSVTNPPGSDDVQVFYYNENGILTSNTLASEAIDVSYCSIGLPFTNVEKIGVIYISCGCET